MLEKAEGLPAGGGVDSRAHYEIDRFGGDDLPNNDTAHLTADWDRRYIRSSV